MTREFDVLVVGSGAAGLTAALTVVEAQMTPVASTHLRAARSQMA